MKHEELSKKIKLIFVNHHSLELIFDKIDHFFIIKAQIDDILENITDQSSKRNYKRKRIILSENLKSRYKNVIFDIQTQTTNDLSLELNKNIQKDFSKNILDMKLNLTMLTPHELFTSPSSRLANVRRLNNTKFNMKEILVKQNFCNYQDDILCTSYKYFGKNLLNCLDKVNLSFINKR